MQRAKSASTTIARMSCFERECIAPKYTTLTVFTKLTLSLFS